jgi:hypothetical protein
MASSPLPLRWGQALDTLHRDLLAQLGHRGGAAQPPDSVTEIDGAVHDFFDGVDVEAAMMMVGGIAHAGQHGLADDRLTFGTQILHQGFGGVGTSGLCFHGESIADAEGVWISCLSNGPQGTS